MFINVLTLTDAPSPISTFTSFRFYFIFHGISEDMEPFMNLLSVLWMGHVFLLNHYNISAYAVEANT
jgi:hypothetical protein